jgi:hypothetical protein
MTQVSPSPLRLIRVGRALDLTRSIGDSGLRESMSSQTYWP